MSLSSEKSSSIVTVHKLKNTSSNHSKDDYQEAWECDKNIMGKSFKIASKLSITVLWTENIGRNIVYPYMDITPGNHFHSLLSLLQKCIVLGWCLWQETLHKAEIQKLSQSPLIHPLNIIPLSYVCHLFLCTQCCCSKYFETWWYTLCLRLVR